ncbi:MAG TPA: SAF domain-containing protein [Acidimicrobiales bacterium]|nr:SAF domain-containing protein [Acidimicrobiales bacterium]
MVMTRPVDRDVATEQGGPPRRVVARPVGIPGARAVVGGLLVALAGVGTFVSWQQASGPPDRSYAVAARPLRPGDPVTADAVRFEPIDLPDGVASASFQAPADLEGRVLVAPVAEGELLQRGVLSDQGDAAAAAEVSLTLVRERAVDGRLQAGDTVDVYATHGDGTSLVAEAVRVVAVSEAGGSLGGREVTVTLALTDQSRRVPVIHAARAGEVTLVRTTHLPRAAPGPAEAPAAADPAAGAGSGAGSPGASGAAPGDGRAGAPPSAGSGTAGDAPPQGGG